MALITLSLMENLNPRKKKGKRKSFALKIACMFAVGMYIENSVNKFKLL